jgi:integrase
MNGHASITLSDTYKGQRRPEPVWLMRYRLPSGKDSRKVLGKAWTRRGRPAAGYMSEAEALVRAQSFISDHDADTPGVRRTFRAALEAFLTWCEEEKQLRGSTTVNYRRIGDTLAERPWRGDLKWDDRPLDTFDDADLLAVRRELLAEKRKPDTVNHYRRVVRGVFGTARTSPALAWDWMSGKVESEGKLHFYTPEQVRRLTAEAHSTMDKAIFTLATEAGPRMSEIRALKVGNVDFEVGVIRFEDGFTTVGGHAGNKGRRVRSVPMTSKVRVALVPFCERRPSGALVFEHPAKPGEPICGISLYRRFVSAAKRAGLPRIKFNELRHSFGTRAIRGFNIYEVQRMMGHRHITTTERYLHYAPDPNAAAKLSGLWGADEGEDGGNVVPLRGSDGEPMGSLGAGGTG